MTREPKIWIAMAVFQVVYGMAVFGLTRDYYLHGPDRSGARPSATEASRNLSTGSPLRPAIPGGGAFDAGGTAGQAPAEISRLADESFARKDYQSAADLYAQLLTKVPGDVDTHNNLGLTLHYLDRSSEALRTLNEGIAIDKENQRIWLTLGYVQSQLGNVEQATRALTNATMIGNDDAIRKSAMEMLRDLP